MKKQTKKIKKSMTIEDLAIITQKGFEGMESRMATKDELKETESRLTEKLNDRCDRIEFIVLRAQDASNVLKTKYDEWKPRLKLMRSVRHF